MNAKANLVDRVVAWVNPEAGVRRQRARRQLEFTNALGRHKGADFGRDALRGAKFTTSDVNDELAGDMPNLRDASIELINNSPLAAGIIHTKCASIVGTGLRLRPQIDREALGLTDEQGDAWERTTRREYEMWANNPLYCDATRVQTMAGLQDLALRSTLAAGDVIAILPVVKNTGPYGIKVQMIEGHRLSNPDFKQDTETLRSGIGLDGRGGPEVYHIQDTHPGALLTGLKTTWTPVRAFGRNSGRRNVVHLFNRRRPGQVRGFPDLAPVIEPLKQMERYLDYEVQAAVINAAYTVFIETEDGGALEGLNATEFVDTREKFYNGKDITLKGGTGIGLFPGDKVTFADPARPSTAFDPFVQAVLRQVGVALELPFEVLVKHFTSSYSAAQAALLEAWRFFRNRRHWLATQFCQPVYETWMMEAVATGRISAPGFFDDPLRRAAYCKAAWIGDPMGHIDPSKSAKANEIYVNMGVKTLEEVTIETTGGEWEANHRQSAKEHEAREEAGLLPMPAAPAGGAAPADDTEGEDEDPDAEDREDEQ